MANKLTECQEVERESITITVQKKKKKEEEQLLSTAQLLVKRIPDKFIKKRWTKLNIFAGLFR